MPDTLPDTLRYAVLGYVRGQSFGMGGHNAYWDGWYSSHELAQAVAEMKGAEDRRMTFVVVERCTIPPVTA